MTRVGMTRKTEERWGWVLWLGSSENSEGMGEI